MSRLDSLKRKRDSLEEESRRIGEQLAEIDPDAHLLKLERAVDKAVKNGNQGAVGAAVKALQEARSGTDEVTTLRVRLEGQRRVAHAALEKTEQDIKAEERDLLDRRYLIAKDLLAEVREEYEVHARAIIDLYPRLYARAILAADTGFPLGLFRSHSEVPAFMPGYGVALPIAQRVGLPKEMDGTVTHHREAFEKEKAEASAELEARFEAARP